MIDNLTKRLSDAFTLIPKGEIVLDVGADRGLLAKELAKSGWKTYASENKKGPYSGLVTNTAEEQKENGLVCLFMDGIDNMPSDVTLVSLLGMGGNTIHNILSRHPMKVKTLHYVLLEPQSDFREAISLLHDCGFSSVGGKYVYERRYYPLLLMKNIGSVSSVSEAELHYGSYPLLHKDPLLLSYLKQEEKRILALPLSILEKKEAELSLLHSALSFYER